MVKKNSGLFHYTNIILVLLQLHLIFYKGKYKYVCSRDFRGFSRSSNPPVLLFHSEFSSVCFSSSLIIIYIPLGT